MKAVRFAGVGRPARIADVPKPEPGPGQALIRIGGAGVCYSDLHLMEEDFGFRGEFTPGHENAGWVAELGAGVVSEKATRSLCMAHGVRALPRLSTLNGELL